MDKNFLLRKTDTHFTMKPMKKKVTKKKKVVKKIKAKKPIKRHAKSAFVSQKPEAAHHHHLKKIKENVAALISEAEHVKHSFTWKKNHAFFIIGFAVIAIFAIFSLVFFIGGKGNHKNQTSTVAVNETMEARQIAPESVENSSVTLIATGDIMLARYVELKMRRNKDYTWPFPKVADFLKSADITFGNLETPLLAGKNVPTDSMTFRADLEGVKGLAFAGYDLLSLANNHVMNYQVPGLTSTIQELKKAGIRYVGAGKNFDIANAPVIIEAKGKKIAFLAYNDKNIPPKFHGEATATMPGIAKMDIEKVKVNVAAAKQVADFVIVSMHAGIEYKKEPNQFQKDFAHAAIDAGAVAVLGHHPHVVEPVEYYGNGVIFYSLGNFVFDQFFNQDVQTGLVVRLTLNPESPLGVELFPVKIDLVQPRILEGEEKDLALKKLGLM